jgi:hypothetical protein
MPAPQTVIQAAVARLSARLGSGLLDAAAQAAVALQDAPERLRQEFSLFWEEVELEAERIERGEAAGSGAPPSPPQPPQDLQGQIDALRAQVAAFSRRLDHRP